MTGAPGFLEFFILEASEYVEQLDGLLLGGGPSGPDGEAIQRVARALRGTSTMAKLPSFAELAGAVERVGRALHDGALRWDPALGGALIAAIDELKSLLHAARAWSPSEDQRAATRTAELSRFAPARTPAAGSASAAAPSQTSYFASEAANIAAGLELLTTRAGDPETAANVLRRVRALRGVAGVKEIAPLADALEATEDAARDVEHGAAPSDESRRLLEAAAGYLRAISAALRSGGGADMPSAARDAFVAARDAWSAHEDDRERVVPIADLFYSDGAPGVVEEAANPPTSSSERFRLELVSLGEHLRQVVDSARATPSADTDAQTRVRRELRRALRALEGAAESFGERDVAEFIRGHRESADHVDFLGLAALQDLSTVLAEPGTQGERLRDRLRELSHGRELTTAIGAGFGFEEPAPPPAVEAPAPATMAMPVVADTPAPANVDVTYPPPGPPPRPTPVRVEALDRSSAALIDSSIAALESLEQHPFVQPVALPEDAVVPIESLLYRGRAALDRAVEIRDQLKRSGPVSDPAALEELFDLLELARAE
ncbi:MAG TPA: Hpt domain-containing protein [Gemmatimonadaceae bacterium]|nr:Hpt domain-containing protein [Gemmatimonadaceae bacterium]